MEEGIRLIEQLEYDEESVYKITYNEEEYEFNIKATNLGKKYQFEFLKPDEFVEIQASGNGDDEKNITLSFYSNIKFPISITKKDNPSGNEATSAFPYQITYRYSTYGLERVVSWLEEGAIVIPDYQRELKWKKEQTCMLIDSIFRNIPLPVIILYEYEKKKFEVVDGQQRLLSMYYYYRNKYPSSLRHYKPADLVNADRYTPLYLNVKSLIGAKWYNKSFADLDDNLKKQFKDYELNVMFIQVDDPAQSEVILDLFERLNTKGTPLTRNEVRLRNAKPALREIFQKYAENRDWAVINKNAFDSLKERVLRFYTLLYTVCQGKELTSLTDEEISHNINSVKTDIHRLMDKSILDNEITNYIEKNEELLLKCIKCIREFYEKSDSTTSPETHYILNDIFSIDKNAINVNGVIMDITLLYIAKKILEKKDYQGIIAGLKGLRKKLIDHISIVVNNAGTGKEVEDAKEIYNMLYTKTSYSRKNVVDRLNYIFVKKEDEN